MVEEEGHLKVGPEDIIHSDEEEEEDDDDDDEVDRVFSGHDEEDLELRPTDVSFHRPTNTEELLALQQAPDDISTLFGEDGIITIDDLIITETDDDDVERNMESDNKLSIPVSKLMYLEKLLRLLAELISTEIDYVRDLGLLGHFLDECTYCSKTAVHSFVNSTTFIGFRVATDNIKSINTLFLKKLQEQVGSLMDIDVAKKSMTEENFSLALKKLESLCYTFVEFSPLFTQYKHLIQLHRPITILYAALGDNSSFLKFVTEVEQKLTQQFLSLSIKPVQRLPRYILLLKEMLKCVHRSVPLFETSDKETWLITRSMLRDTCIMISNCTLLCNNAMREYEDLQKLHLLDRQFKNCQLKKKFKFVTIRKNRVHVVEGIIRRRHDRIGIKSYLCHVFSDIMLVSVVVGKGGLRLKNIIPLHENCGVACIPVPNSALWSTESTADGCWFVMITNKIMFFAVKSSQERDRWVRAINAVLHKNNGDYDILFNADRMEVYNKHAKQYYKRHGDTESSIAEAERAVCVTQVNWWQILSTSTEKGVGDTLRMGNETAINRLMKTFDKKKMGPLVQLFADKSKPHFPICYAYFFDCPKKTSKSSSNSSSDFNVHPPSVVKLYLFHDVIIAATLSGNEDNQSVYYFHIDLSSLEVPRSDESSLVITLVDTSVVTTKGIMQNLWKSTVREHSLIASSIEEKKQWTRFLNEAISTLKSTSPISINPEFCKKVQRSRTAAWKYEERPSINWDNL